MTELTARDIYRAYHANPQRVIDALGEALEWQGEWDDPVLTSDHLKRGVLAVLDALLPEKP